MVKSITLLLIGVLALTLTCYGNTHRDVFDKYYRSAVLYLENSDYPGPLSIELARVALARQILEDGPQRKETESIAGISVGGFNKEIVESTVPSHIQVKSATDSTGARFYYFTGLKSNLYSMFVISKLFDYYVFKFMKTEKRNWILSKETSKAIAQNPDCLELNIRFYNELNPAMIIDKANKMYGPGHQSVVNIYTR